MGIGVRSVGFKFCFGTCFWSCRGGVVLSYCGRVFGYFFLGIEVSFCFDFFFIFVLIVGFINLEFRFK